MEIAVKQTLADTADARQLRADLAEARGAAMALADTKQAVTERLDSAIDRVKSVLEDKIK